MDRRKFLKSAFAAGMIAGLSPGCAVRRHAAEPRSPMGKRPAAGEELLIHSAKVVDVETGALFPERALLIRDGKVERRIPDGEVGECGAGKKIDAGGRYLIPGLINAHCHMTLPGVIAPDLGLILHAGDQIDRNCVDCILHGVTTVRDQFGAQDSIVDRQDRIRGGQLLGPRILRGIVVDVPGGYFDFHGLFFRDGIFLGNGSSEIRDSVGRAVDSGADHIKFALQFNSFFRGMKPLSAMTPELLATAVERADQLGRPTAVHHVCIRGYRRAIRVGIRVLEHVVADSPLSDEDIELFIDSGCALVPTTSVAWALIFPQEDDEKFNHPLVREMYRDKLELLPKMIREYCIEPVAEAGEGLFEKYGSPGYFDRKHLFPTQSNIPFTSAGSTGMENMMLMYKAGCRVGCGNDGGVTFVWPGALPFEMLLNEEAGMSAPDVLRSATAVNAEIIGMPESLGAIQPGKIADLVFLEKNPLVSMENLFTVDAVIRSGRLIHSNGRIKEEAV